MKEKIVRKLEEFKSATPSRWREQALERREDEAWRQESRRIALLMLERLDALAMTQADLAERLGCTQQYVSRILKGRENLSLKTICKIDDVLGLGIGRLSAVRFAWHDAAKRNCAPYIVGRFRSLNFRGAQIQTSFAFLLVLFL